MSQRQDDGVGELLEDDEPPTYSVLLRRKQTWDFARVSEALQVQAMMSVADASRIARRRPGILLAGAARDSARDVVKALRAEQVDCFLAPDADLFPPPIPATIDSLELLADGLRGRLSAHTDVVASCPYGSIALLASARISSGSPGGDVYTALKRGPAVSSGGRKQVLAFGREVARKDFHVLDVYCGFTHRGGPGATDMVLHVDAMQFDFGCLGDARGTHGAHNVRELLRRLAGLAKGAALDPGAAALMEGDGPGVSCDNLVEFQTDTLWRLDLLELDRRKREREAGGA